MSNKFIFLGDSLTYGYGVSKKYCWVSLLEKNLNLKIINAGINGSTTTDMLCRLSQVLSNDYPNIFIMGGTNDLLSNRPVKSIIDNIDLIIRECINADKKVILGIPPIIIPELADKLFVPSLTYKYCADSLNELHCQLITLCHKYCIEYIDFYNVTKKNLSNGIFLDGIHYNESGHQYLYDEAFKTIK